MILLIIIFNQHFIKFTNRTYSPLIPIRLHSQYTKSHLLYIENWFSFIALLKHTNLLLHY